MPAPSLTSTEAQIAWLTDRAQIHDLLLSYARCADTKDWKGYADLFADDGRIVWPHGGIPKHAIAASIERILEPYEMTHHLFSNIGIEIDGDTARTNHYLHATHVASANAPGQHADIGGWYDNEFRRTPEGWRFTSLDLTFVWSAGDVFEPGIPG
jgi:ketosteroid isomerase-like protein